MKIEKGKSKKEFEHNVKTEYKKIRKDTSEGKEKADKKAVAISFGEKKSAEKRDRKEDKKK